MSDLIRRDELLEEFEWLKYAKYPCNRAEVEDAIQRIKNAKSVDAVEVVRCNECKLRSENLPPCAYFQRNGFCSFGKK